MGISELIDSCLDRAESNETWLDVAAAIESAGTTREVADICRSAGLYVDLLLSKTSGLTVVRSIRPKQTKKDQPTIAPKAKRRSKSK